MSRKVPISRSCQGWAATDLLDSDERILSFKRGAGRSSLASSPFPLIFKDMTKKKQNIYMDDKTIHVKLNARNKYQVCYKQKKWLACNADYKL